MKKIYSLLALSLLSAFAMSAQTLVSARPIDTSTAIFLNFFANGRAKYDVVTFKITYNTTDVDGSSTVASGAFSVPIQSACDSFGLVAYDHGTVLEKDNVPSRNNFESNLGKVIASTGYVAAMPDYLGLGDNAGLHPYIHAETQATATVDIMRAVREYAAANPGDSIRLNGEVMLTGYSQGGHAAMATAQYIQNNSLEGEFNVIAAAPASGPYDLAGFQSEVFIQDQPYSNPGYVVYLLMGMNRVYGNIYQNVEEILKAPYDSIIPPYFNGQYPMDSVNSKLPAKISGYLEDTVLANFVNDTVNQNHPIWQMLNANTNYDWRPNMPMRLFYCTNDEQVDYRNALRAEAAMTARGASVKAINKGALNHGGCVAPSITGALNFFDSATTSCNRQAIPVSLLEEDRQPFAVYPNPAQDWVRLESEAEDVYEVRIFGPTGRLIYRRQASGSLDLATADWPAGVYLVTVNDRRSLQSFQLLVR